MRLPPLSKEAIERLDRIGKEIMDKMKTRCNCDASCGENRYHDVGSSGCRFANKEEYDAYWNARNWSTRQIALESEKKSKRAFESAMESVMNETKDFDEIMEKIVEERKKPYVESMKRPWGEWHVLDVDQGFKVKRLHILPDQSISLQYHVHRAEIWNIVQGEGKVIIDGDIFSVKKGDTFIVPKQALHKITNTHLTEMLIAVEVQLGEICREDDIVRC